MAPSSGPVHMSVELDFSDSPGNAEGPIAAIFERDAGGSSHAPPDVGERGLM